MTPEEILNGKFHNEVKGLEFSRNRIDMTLFKGEAYEGSVRVQTVPSGLPFTGIAYATDIRMQVLQPDISEENNEIRFAFRGEYAEAGDQYTGSLMIVSDCGEYEIPYTVVVEEPQIIGSSGVIGSPEEFAAFAKNRWKEAVRYFYSDAFAKLLRSQREDLYLLYRGFSAHPMNESNMEKFLYCAGLKEKVEFKTETDLIRLFGDHLSVQQEIRITRSGWGYIYLRVETDGDFLSVEKTVLQDDDFLGSYHAFRFYIRPEVLHKGVNYGRIRFSNAVSSITVNVEIRKEDTLRVQKRDAEKNRRDVLRIMDLYGQFRMRRLTVSEWLQKNYDILKDWLAEEDGNPEPRLYHAHLLMTEQRYNEAGWVLDRAKQELMASSDKSQSLWCYYLYLKCLRTKEEALRESIYAEIQESYYKHPDDWQIAWIYMYICREISGSSVNKWKFLKDQFDKGISTPVFYIEALQAIAAEPSLFRELGAFEMQMLRYAAKHRYLTKDIVMELHYLVPRLKQVPKGLVDVLCSAYALKPDTETLQDICTLLIRENRRDKNAFTWYEKAVEANLRITGLCEYYMESLDLSEDKMLPKVVYLYFTYNNSLSTERNSYLYASLYKYREEMADVYESKQLEISEFALQMAQEGRINKSLAYLYGEILTEQLLSGTSVAADKIYFAHHFKTDDTKAAKLVVIRRGLVREDTYALSEGRCLVPLYLPGDRLLKEDIRGNRIGIEDSEEPIRYMPEDSLFKNYVKADPQNAALLLYLCKYGSSPVITEETEPLYVLVRNHEDVEEEYRNSLLPLLLEFNYRNDRQENVAALLEGVGDDTLTREERCRVFTYLVQADCTERAKKWVLRYGTTFEDEMDLGALAEKLIDGQKIPAFDDQIAKIAMGAFERGQKTVPILTYLATFYCGGTVSQLQVWKDAGALGLPKKELSERILSQALRTSCNTPAITRVFLEYMHDEARDESLVKAFLMKASHDHFMRMVPFSEDLADCLGNEMQEGRLTDSLICMLAYTTYYAEHRQSISLETGDVLQNCLNKLMAKGIVLPCFSDYAPIFPEMERYYDKTILEYRKNPGSRAVIHYRITDETDTSPDYKSAPMQVVYGDMCTASFVLFLGEKLSYFIVEETDEEDEEGNMRVASSVNERGTLTRSDMGHEGVGNRFGMLNDIIISYALQDYRAVNRLLDEYQQMDYVQEVLFHPQVEENEEE